MKCNSFVLVPNTKEFLYAAKLISDTSKYGVFFTKRGVKIIHSEVDYLL